MELRHYLAILRRRIALVLLAVVVGVAAAWAFTPGGSRYSARAVIYVGAQKFSVAPGNSYTFDPTQLVGQLITTYAKMLDSEPVAQDALQSTGIPRTPKQVVAETQVAPEKGTQLLDITVADRDPVLAQRLANGIADAFVSKVKAFNTSPGQGSLPSVPAYIFQRPDLPTSPESNGLVRNMVLGGFFGLLVALGAVLLLDYLDNTIKTPSEAEDRLQLPVLGLIPFELPRDGSLGLLAPARGMLGRFRERESSGVRS